MQKTQVPEPLGPGAVRALKITVVVMGLLIFAGLALVIARIITLSSQSSTQPTRAYTPAPARSELAIPPGTAIKSLSLSASRLAIHYETTSGGEIIILDIASGKTLSRIKLVPTTPTN